MKPTIIIRKRAKRKSYPDLGFHFTPTEEILIARAGVLSRSFMAGYGKGETPVPIDLRYYYNNDLPLTSEESPDPQQQERKPFNPLLV